MKTALLLVTAMLLAGIGIGDAFRSDEVWSLQRAAEPWSEMMAQLRADVHPPLFYVLLRGWCAIAGSSETASRLLNVLFYWAAALALWKFSQRRLAALIYLASPVALVAEHLVRMYALLGLCAAFSTLLYLRLNGEEEPRRDYWLWYVLANMAGSFTHVWFFFLLISQGLGQLILFRGKRLPRFSLAAVLSLAPYATLWLPVLLEQSSLQDNLAWLKPPGASDLVRVILMLGGGALPVAAFALWSRRKHDPGREWIAPAFLFLVTLVIPFALSFYRPVFGVRFSIVALPALCLAVAAVAEGLVAEITVAVLGMLVAVSPLFQDKALDSRNTARLLAAEARPGDLVVFTNLSRLAVDHYLPRDRPWSSTSFPKAIDAHPGFVGHLDFADLNKDAGNLIAAARRDGVQRIFFLHGHDPRADAPLKDRLEKEFQRLPQPAVENAPETNYVTSLAVYSSRSTSSGF